MPTGYKVALAVGLVAVLGILVYIAATTETNPTETAIDTTGTGDGTGATDPGLSALSGTGTLDTGSSSSYTSAVGSGSSSHSEPTYGSGNTNITGSSFNTGSDNIESYTGEDVVGTDNVYGADERTTSSGSESSALSALSATGGAGGYEIADSGKGDADTSTGEDAYGSSTPGSTVAVSDGQNPDSIRSTSVRPADVVVKQQVYDEFSDAPGFSYSASSTSSVSSSSTNTDDAVVYTVQKNDRLWNIAVKRYGNGANAKAIMDANPGLTANTLRPGMKIVLPAISSDLPAPVAQSGSDATTNVPAGMKVVLVKSGETLSHIAQRELGRASATNQILEANPGINPKKIYVGQAIYVPKTVASRQSTVSNEITPVGYRRYTIKSGDNYWVIAKNELGDGSKAMLIKEANPDVNPKRLRVGKTILLPE